MADHKYPKTLTKKDWLKKKGAVAKMAGKTGVGSAMDDLEKSYKKVNWNIFDPGKALPMDRKAQTKEGLVMVVKNAKAEYKNSISAAVAPNLKALKKTVTEARDKFKKSKTIPKKAADHADAVLAEIQKMEDEIDEKTLVAELKKNVDQKLKDFAVYDKMMKGMKTKLKTYVVALARDAKSVRTVDEFKESWSENIRGVGTTLPQLAGDLGLEAEHKRWRTYASQNFFPKTDEEVRSKYAALLPDLKSIAAAVR